MAISTYDDLFKRVSSYGERGSSLDDEIDDFILLAETEMYNNQREPLKIRDMETIQTATTSTGRFLALPDNYESMRSTRIDIATGGEIRYQSPEQLVRDSFTGRPCFFTITGNEIEFDRTPDSEYTIELQVFTRPTGLSATNQTNSVLTKYPTIYLYGVLAQFFSRAQDDEQARKYYNLFIDAIKGANKAQKIGKYGPAPQMFLDRGMTP